MGIFSKSCEYGLRAVVYVADASAEGRKVGVKEVAEEIDSPLHFLAKILQNLSKQGILSSSKGPGGGFYIEKSALDLSLAKVVEAIDGRSLFEGCAMGLKKCSAKKPCPLHNDFGMIRSKITKMLESQTIGDFRDNLLKVDYFLDT